MADKPTYKELEQRIRDLELEIEKSRSLEERFWEHESILNSFFDNAHEFMGIIEVLDDEHDLRYIKLNKAAGRYVGKSPEALQGMLASQIGVTEEVRCQWIEQCRKSERTSIPARFEYKRELPDGVHTLLASASLIKSPRFSFVVMDITERKRAEDELKHALTEKTTLLQELYHRTKNNMQVIHSMLALRASYIQDEQLLTILEDIQEKIFSMALVHQKLYESHNLSSIDLKEYIDDLTVYLAQSYQMQSDRISLDLDTDSVFVLIDTAIPCGLILSELISNAFKHAFPGDRAGRISIQLHREEDETIMLQVSDAGIGVPNGFDFRKLDALGLQTMVGIVEHQLRGEVTLETDHGMVWQIRFRDNLYRPRV